jgi:dTDP-4-dehydrorhamnose reductase
MSLTSTTHVLLIGAGGQLARAIERRLTGHCRLTTVSRAVLDITKPSMVDTVTTALRPDVIVNCASYNDVDGAERNAAHALEVNGIGVDAVAVAAARCQAVLVHYSTDFVFDPDVDPGPLPESASVRPRSVYAQSKLLGEILARRVERRYILRVESLFGGPRPKSSLDRIASTLVGGGTVNAFADRTVSPSYVVDIADATARLLASAVPHGLYHCVNSGAATWLEVVRTLAQALGVDPDEAVRPVPFDPSAFPARRPRYAALSNAALSAHGITMPAWQDAIGRYAREVRSAPSTRPS